MRHDIIAFLKEVNMGKLPLVAVLCLSPALAAAQAANFHPLSVKTGLWQTTVDNVIKGGMPQLPPDMQARLAAMPPEQRARIEAMMNGAPQSNTHKHCVTKEDLDKAAQWSNGAKCTWTIITSTSTDLEARGTDCDLGRNEGAKSSIHIKIHVVDGENIQGKYDGSLVSGEGHTETLNGSYSSKWLGPTCPADTQ